jgi:hypothetical protein
MSGRDDLSDLHSAAVDVQDALAELVERLEALLLESDPEPKPVPDAERFLAEVPAEPPGRLSESLHTRIKVRNNVATKADVQASEAAIRGELRAETAVIRGELAQTRTELKADIAASQASVRAPLAGEIGHLDTRIERLDATVKAQPNAIMLRLGTLMVVLTGIILAALRYWPPGHGG